jgi:hypothetical protein
MASPTTWAHLPNAPHIDWVLRSLLAHPEQWDAARDAAWGAARDAARDAAWDAAWDAARDAARGAAWGAAWGAVAALIAWDHAGTVLTMDDEAFGGALALDPHMVLLAPARAVFKWETKEKK